MDIARFSNFIRPDSDPDFIRGDAKGKNAIGVMAIGENEPKGQEDIGGKITKMMIEGFMRRPSMKDEAFQKLTEFAHDAIAAQQNQDYMVTCSVGMVATVGGSYRWMCAGDVRIFHYVNGQMMHESGNAPELGLKNGQKKDRPEVCAETAFGEGENNFLICSGSFARTVPEAEIEDALAAAENAEGWLKALKALYEERGGEEPYALMTIFVPQKRKRLSKKAVIIIIIAVVVLAVGAFFALGAAKRKNAPPGGQGGPGQNPPRQEQGAPGAPPTEPPEPEAPGGGGGNPGEKPTRPPQPTQPPEPEAPAEGPEGAAAP